MKRRTLIFGSSGLAALSLGTTASMASFAFETEFEADFRVVIPASIVSSLQAVPNTENDLSEHTWEFDELEVDADIEEIEVNYPHGTEFDEVITDTVTVLFQQGNNLKEVDVLSVTRNDPSAIFELDPDNIGGSAEVIIDEIRNPDAGTYAPEIVFRVGDEEINGDKGLAITDDDAEFEIGIDAPSDVFVGEELVVEYTVENVGDATGSQEIALFVDGDEEGTTGITLEAGDTATKSFGYEVVNDDSPSVDVEVTTNDDSDDDTVEVIGAWEVDPDPTTTNDDSIHTWSTEGIVFDGEIDEITIEYLDDRNNRLEFDNRTDVTIEITRDDEASPSEIGFTAEFDDSEAVFDLDDDEETTVDGEIVITIDDLRNPQQEGEYQGAINLDGKDDEFSATVTFEID